jgi:imidazole glycerol phosphate synthase subunit HisF
MNHDGTKDGFACEAIARLSETLSIPVIASGEREKWNITVSFCTGIGWLFTITTLK